MLPLRDPRWADLQDAYGNASKIPGYLAKAVTDLGPGHRRNSGDTEFRGHHTELLI